VIESFKQQLDRVAFAHMGFLPQNLGKSLPDFLIQSSPEGLDHVYFVSGGSEAVGAESDPSASIDRIFYLDLELGYDVSENLRITAGGSNILDKYVDDIDAPNANRMSAGLQYPRRTAANYEGGSWYLRANCSF
jgi:outer membrane receptor protein involved in Fe transport